MYSFFYKVYFLLRRMEKNRDKQGLFYKLIFKMTGYIEAYYNFIVVKFYQKQPKNESGVLKEKRKQKIIVSLTSYPKRMETLWIVIETLMRQSMKPDEIILWLSTEQFEGMDRLPDTLLKQREWGLTIRFCDEDLKSHKKYFYVMQEYPSDIIILVDDDMFYPYDTIEKLYKLHKNNPNDICVMTSQVMKTGFSSMPSSWKNPKNTEKIKNSSKVQIYTGSGSLFIPHSLDKDVFKRELIFELCLYADDLWLTFMAYKKGTKISSMPKWRAFPISIYGTAQDSLWFINAQDGKNDEQWTKLLEYYPEVVERYEK